MKKLIALLFLFTALHARADMVITKEVEMHGDTQHIVVKIKGDKARMDFNDGSSKLLDLKTGGIVMLFPEEKKFVKSTAAQQKAEAKKETDSTQKSAVELQPVDTGKKEKVRDGMAEIYTAEGPKEKYTFWISSDFPNWEAVRVEIKKLGEKMGADTSKIPGLIVKRRGEYVVDGGVHVITTTLISAKEEPVDAAVFEIPAGYTETKFDDR